MFRPEQRVAAAVDLNEREVALVGGGIAVVSAAILIASLFVPWYRHSAFCDAPAACPARLISGWTALGVASAVIAAGAVGGLLPVLGLDRRWKGWLCWLGSVAGLGAALLVVFRVAVPPPVFFGQPVGRLAGPFIALLGAFGVAGGSILAGLGERFFDRARHGHPALLVAFVSPAVLIASLFVPWIRRSAPVRLGSVSGLAGTQTAWHGMQTVAILLLLGALAIAAAALLVAVVRWRCAFVGLAGGGWLMAAITVAATPVAVGSRMPSASGLAGYEVGYYVCLAAATAIAIAGLWAAVVRK